MVGYEYKAQIVRRFVLHILAERKAWRIPPLSPIGMEMLDHYAWQMICSGLLERVFKNEINESKLVSFTHEDEHLNSATKDLFGAFLITPLFWQIQLLSAFEASRISYLHSKNLKAVYANVAWVYVQAKIEP